MPFISPLGIKTYYQKFGNNVGKIPAVIFIHGAGQSTLCWKFQKALAEVIDKFSFIFIDLPGHGKSTGSGFNTVKAYSDFIHEFIKELDIDEYILIGHSMGGRIAQVHILEYPEPVIGCVLAGSGARIRVTNYTMECAKNRFEEFASLASENALSASASEKLREEFKSWILDTNQQTVINDLEACNKFDTREEISRFNVPALIIAGDKDNLATPEHYLHLKNEIPDSKLEIIKGAGHFMMLEKPAEFNRLVAVFLNYL